MGSPTRDKRKGRVKHIKTKTYVETALSTAKNTPMWQITVASLVLSLMGGSCTYSAQTPSSPKPLALVIEELKEVEEQKKGPRFTSTAPSSVKCAICNIPLGSIAAELANKEKQLEKREEKLYKLFTPNAKAIKKLDWFSPEYQEHARHVSLLAQELRLERAEKANVRFLYLLQQNDHLFCFDPIFLEDLRKLKIQYKKLHEGAQSRMEKEYALLRKEYGQLKAEDRIAQLRKKELQRQIKSKSNNKRTDPLESIEPLTLLKSRIQKYYKVHHDPFQQWVMPFPEDLTK